MFLCLWEHLERQHLTLVEEYKNPPIQIVYHHWNVVQLCSRSNGLIRLQGIMTV